MSKKNQQQNPASPEPAATATCPAAHDTSAATEPVSAICATNIACATQAPFCPEKEPDLKPHTIGHTGWHTCVAHTQEMPGCTTVTSPPVGAAAQPIGTWFQGCGIPPVTLNCQPQTIHTWFAGCGIPPATLDCPQQAAAPTGTIGYTGWYTCHQQGNTAATVCTQVGCPPQTHLLGCTTATANPHTDPAICGTGPQAAAPAGTIGVTGWYTCHQQGGTAATVCTQVGCAEATPAPSPTTTLVGPTGWYTCHQQGGTAATVCTQVGCPPHMHNTIVVGPTGWYGCHKTVATVCTQVGCAPQTHLLGCKTVTAPPVAAAPAGGTIGVTGWYTCHQQGGTAATVCTQIGCAPQTHLLGCTTVTAPPHTNPAVCGTGPQPVAAGTIGVTGWHTCGQVPTCGNDTKVWATLITQPFTHCACPAPTTTIGVTGWQTCVPATHLLGCTTATTPPTNLAVCGTGPQAAGAVGPTGWYTCGHVPTCGQTTHIIATTYTQIGC